MLKFENAEPIPSNRGRKAEENLFEEVVASIAGKTNESGKAVARATIIQVGKDEDIVKVSKSVKAKLKSAGLKCTPAVTVHSNVDFADDNKSFKVTFWTGPKITRTPKDKDGARTASSPQTDAENGTKN